MKGNKKMELFIMIFLLIMTTIIIRFVYKINIKEIKKIGEDNQELDEMVKKYPSNIEICRSILKKLNNEKVKIQEDKQANNCLYIAVSDKILIANMRESFTRIQTIAHECLHSVQDRRILLFNYIFSICYLASFYILALIGIFKFIPYKILALCVFVFLSFIYYFVRSYLEDDAMTKARFLAKEYMEEENISEKKEIDRIVQEYDKLNNLGIKTTNYSLFFSTVVRMIILCIIFIIR